ncbi:hypothetical protein D3C85_1545000 [compost metagenome]
MVVAVPIDDNHQDQRRQADGLDDRNQRIIAKISHDRPIHAEANEQRNCHDRRADKQPEMLPERVVYVIDTQTHDERQPQGSPDQNNICEYLYKALAASGKPQQA